MIRDKMMKEYKEMGDSLQFDQADSPRAILFQAKTAYTHWKGAYKRLNLLLFQKQKDEEFQAELRKTERIGMDVSTMEQIGGMDAELLEAAKKEEEEREKLFALEKKKDETRRKQNLEILLSEDPMVEIKYEILQYERKSDDTYKRADAFGIDRREHMKKYAKCEKIVRSDILISDDERELKGMPKLPREKRKLADTLEADITNLLENIKVDQIVAGEVYDFPESLNVGLKGYILFKGMCEDVVADQQVREAELKEKTTILEAQVKRYKEKLAELERREADIRTLIKKLQDNPMKTGKAEALKEKEEKLQEIEALKTSVLEGIEKNETEKQELAQQLKVLGTERKRWDQFSLDTQVSLNRQANSYNEMMRQLKAIRIAKQIAEDSTPGDYRDNMLDILADMEKETLEFIDTNVRSVFQKKIESTQTIKDLSDDYLVIFMRLSNLYDEIRAKREELPKKPTDHAETPEEQKIREQEEERIKQEVDKMMNDARKMIER